MQPWIQSAVGASILIGAHYLLLRNASGRIGDSLGAFVLEGTATLGILVSWFMFGRGETTPTTKPGLFYSALSGLAISGASILLFATLRKGAPVASTGTIVLGGGVALAALVSPWLFDEPYTLRRAIGVGLGLAGVFVLSSEGSGN
jgi:uncharacterized membrane protein